MVNDSDADDICIVSMGCFLPLASNLDEYWEQLISGRTSIDRISKKRLDIRYYQKNLPGEIYEITSDLASEISEAKIQGLRSQFSSRPDLSRFDLVTLEAFRQTQKTSMMIAKGHLVPR